MIVFGWFGPSHAESEVVGALWVYDTESMVRGKFNEVDWLITSFKKSEFLNKLKICLIITWVVDGMIPLKFKRVGSPSQRPASWPQEQYFEMLNNLNTVYFQIFFQLYKF